MSAKFYEGSIDPDLPYQVIVHEPTGIKRHLPARLDVRQHSRGFAWGYEGSGPAQLALALLCDAVGRAKAKLLYQDFKSAVVAHWDQDAPWRITAPDIIAWAARQPETKGAP